MPGGRGESELKLARRIPRRRNAIAATAAQPHTKHVVLPQKMVKLILQRCLRPDAIAMIMMVCMAGSDLVEKAETAVGNSKIDT